MDIWTVEKVKGIGKEKSILGNWIYLQVKISKRAKNRSMREIIRSKRYRWDLFSGWFELFFGIFKFFSFSFLLSFIERDLFEKFPLTQKVPFPWEKVKSRGVKKELQKVWKRQIFSGDATWILAKWIYILSMDKQYGQNRGNGYTVWTKSKCTYILSILGKRSLKRSIDRRTRGANEMGKTAQQ